MRIVPIIFSGHNDRAVVVLCRFLSSVGRNFFVIARDDHDSIFQTQWASYVLIRRTSSDLSIELFEEIHNTVQARGGVPCICPTSEFLNRFLIDNEYEIRSQGWEWMFPSSDIYLALSNKSQSPSYVESLIGLQPPVAQKPGNWLAPCVLKPKNNLLEGKILYPLIFKNQQELCAALNKIELDHWFSQQWIEGQSLYLCAYLDQFGCWDGFWQENLLQQPDGKSMVLARTCNNPGVNVTRLMQGLYEMGYRGPFMMELIQDAKGSLHFIEINPRFWGPLDLARKACPALLRRYLSDMDSKQMVMKSQSVIEPYIYAWAYGARQEPLKVYPAAASLTRDQIQSLLQLHDVYAYPDTQVLSQKF